MPRYQKWLAGVSSDAPADEVARQALTERLLAVSHFLDECIGGDDESDAIHQLRVWSRRAAAALELFEPALPAARRREMKKTLKKLRRAAGAVRDCDIHLQRMTEDDAQAPKRMIRAIRKERRLARQKLKSLRRKYRKNKELPLRIEKLLAAIQWPKKHSSRNPPAFDAFCRRQLAPHASAFFKLADADLNDDARLHALRIAGKQWRYALELAPVALPATEHRRLYQTLNELQDRFGDVCDQLATLEQLRDWQEKAKQKSHREVLDELLQRDKRRLRRKRAQVIRWWSTARRQRLKKLWKKVVT